MLPVESKSGNSKNQRWLHVVFLFISIVITKRKIIDVEKCAHKSQKSVIIQGTRSARQKQYCNLSVRETQ